MAAETAMDVAVTGVEVAVGMEGLVEEVQQQVHVQTILVEGP